jgi:hypothetical protein
VRRLAAILVAVASLLTAADAGAGSLPGGLPQLLPPRFLTQVGAPVPPPTPFRSGFSISRPGGYRVNVFTFGTAVILEILHGSNKHLSATAYLGRGVATPRRLQATFGKLGKISMRFEPPRKGGVKSICRFGERISRHRGAYVGHLTFKGEGGYLSLDVHRASGSILTPVGGCRHRHLTAAEIERFIEELFEPVSGLLATSRKGVATTVFMGLKRRHRTIFFAEHEETHGKLAIIRWASAAAAGDIRSNEAATSAKVAPPKPFHGTGRYRAAPDGSSTWTGNLSANFPGAPRLPLTGPDFQALLEVPF